MKRFLTMFVALSVIFTFTACSDEENNDGGEQPKSYLMEATPLDGSQFAAFQDSEARFSLVEEDNGELMLLMEQVKFVEQMPRITIDAPGVILNADGEFAAETLIPRFNGESMPRYSMTNVVIKCDESNGTLKVEFDCFTMHIKYEGAI